VTTIRAQHPAMLTIAPMDPAHWPAVRRIYEEGIATGMATFETEAPDWAAWDARHLATPRLVAHLGEEVVGWAALLPVSSRVCYRGVAEVSIYVAGTARGHGIGRALLVSLIQGSEAAGLWTLFSSIHSDNAPSLALHAACGFRTVGRRERIARRTDGWCDTVIMERRSDVVGID
jgi:L-amino acid N-acyltransferase YncA